MLITKDNPVGIDSYIDRLQRKLYSELGSKWVEDQWKCYPRCYKNKRKDSNGDEYFIPEYSKTLIEYEEVLFDDSVNVLSFFIKNDNATFTEYKRPVVDVSLIISTKLNDLYPSVGHRADEELKQDVYNIVAQWGQGFELTDIRDGIDNVYSEFKKDNIVWSNISPRHVVRFDFTLTYDIKCNCC